MASEEVIERMPPQDVEAEMAVLGSMLIDVDAVGKAIEILGDEEPFYRPAHQKIFRAAANLFEKQQPVDMLTLTDELRRLKWLDDVGGSYYLTELTQRIPSAANVEYYAKIVLEKSLLRKLIRVSHDIAADAYEARKDPLDVIDAAEEKIFKLSERRLRRGFLSMSHVLDETLGTIESFHNRKGVVTGVPTGYTQLDELTSGFQKSELIIVAGRPSMGKTAFCLNIARNAAVDHQVPVGIFSLEMADYQLVMRMLCAEAKVDAHKVRTGRLPDRDWRRISYAAGKLAEAPIFIDDSPALSVLEIRAKARRLAAEYNIGMIIIDYLQLIKGPARSESRTIEISMISQALKALAKELNVPVVALSQLSRAVESRGGDRRPILSDLRESGAIEQDADVVLFIYRPEVYAPAEVEGVAEVIIGKQRNGPTGIVKLKFLKEYVSFVNLDLQHANEHAPLSPF